MILGRKHYYTMRVSKSGGGGGEVLCETNEKLFKMRLYSMYALRLHVCVYTVPHISCCSGILQCYKTACAKPCVHHSGSRHSTPCITCTFDQNYTVEQNSTFI